MAGKQRPITEELTELVRTLLIAQLGLAGVPQRNIRAVARCDMNRVSKVIKELNVPEKRETKRREHADGG